MITGAGTEIFSRRAMVAVCVLYAQRARGGGRKGDSDKRGPVEDFLCPDCNSAHEGDVGRGGEGRGGRELAR